MLSALPETIHSQIHEAEITKARNDWKVDKNGRSYNSRFQHLLGSNPSGRLAAARSQLENEFEARLDEAHARQGTSWRSETRAPVRGRKERPRQVKAGGVPPFLGPPYRGVDQATDRWLCDRYVR